MILKKTWEEYRKGPTSTKQISWTGYFLFGFIPIYVSARYW